MKRYILTLLAVVLPYFCVQAQEHSIEIDASSFAAVQTDMISGVAIDKIGKDHSNRECARIKMRINRMTAAEIGELSVRPRGGNVEVMKCAVAAEGNGLIIELTAKEPTTFYITHPKYGDSNEVSLNLEGGKEYKLNAELNISYPIFVSSNIIGADVYIDNIYMGRTDDSYTLTVKDIQPGTHLLRLEHGSSSTERQIEVTGDNLTYRIEINTATSRPQYVVFEVVPRNAVVVIDHKSYMLDADGCTQVLLSNGTYSYQVSAKDYHSESGEFKVSGAKVEKSITLKPAFGWLNIAASGTLKDANIFVDDNHIGKTPISRSKLTSGTHHIRIVRDMYVTYEDSITIGDGQELNYSASLAPDFATVTIMADSGCDIYVNDVFRGKSPWSGTLSTGTYIFEARKLGHRTTMLSKSITAVPAQQSYKLDAPTPIIGTINITCTPLKADVYIDNKLVGTTPMMHDLLVGEHKVTIRKEGYSDKSLNVTVTEGNVENLNVTLAKKTTNNREIEYKITNNREIRYTATKKITIKDTEDFGANIIYHTWDPQSKTGVIKFDREVTEIGVYAFAGCSSLTSITIPESVTSIKGSAFSGCSSLKSITIPNSVTSIGYQAFKGCSSLTSITIPERVTSIGSRAFEDCSSLTSVYCKATTPPVLGIDAFRQNGSGRKIYVPRNSVNAYKSAGGWSYYASNIVGYDF